MCNTNERLGNIEHKYWASTSQDDSTTVQVQEVILSTRVSLLRLGRLGNVGVVRTTIQLLRLVGHLREILIMLSPRLGRLEIVGVK